MSEYEQIGERSVASEALQLASRLAMQTDRPLEDYICSGDAVRELTLALSQKPQPHRLFGQRTEEMFGYVVAALGHAMAIKREDCGSAIVPSGKAVAIPDYRLMLSANEILVEVKNCHTVKPNEAVRLTSEYLGKLAAYGRIFRRPVYLAVHWSAWNMWTLHPVDELEGAVAQGASLSFGNAAQSSHMAILGDAMLATVPPLRLRLDVDSTLVGAGGDVSEHRMTIRAVHLFGGDNELTEKTDKNLAFYFMMNGNWKSQEPRIEMQEGKVNAIEFFAVPEAEAEDQSLSFLGHASSMASAHFRSNTATEGKGITKLRLAAIRSHPFPGRDWDFSASKLPIWRFEMKPRSFSESNVSGSSKK